MDLDILGNRKGEKRMRVELVQATPNPIEFVARIAGICYHKEDTATPEKRFRHLLEKGHHSVFEHAYYTFRIEGISRVTLAQLTRHRHTSPTVESQRYVDQAENEVIIPETIRNNTKALEIFNTSVAFVKNSYRELRELNIPKEDARYILPEGNETQEYLSLNLRELIHIYNLRTSPQAQWEIKDLAIEMVRQVIKRSPELKFAFERGIVNE